MKRPREPFRFKQFSVIDEDCSLKVGTDAVLLGAWAGVSDVRTALDIGTGSGILALMIAQRTTPWVQIDAVEIDEIDAQQARENFSASPWSSRIALHAAGIQDFNPERHYDLIITNPPFFSDDLVPPAARRKAARHTSGLTHPQLAGIVQKLLNPGGRFALILPVTEGEHFVSLAASHNLCLRRRMTVYPTPAKPPSRWLMEFSAHTGHLLDERLILLEDGARSTAYQRLTADFYPGV